jgi:hypothetical protein
MTTTHDSKTNKTVTSNGNKGGAATAPAQSSKPRNPPPPPARKPAEESAPEATETASTAPAATSEGATPPATADAAQGAPEGGTDAEKKKAYYNKQRETLGPVGFIGLKLARSGERMIDYLSELKLVSHDDVKKAVDSLGISLEKLADTVKILQTVPKDVKPGRRPRGASAGTATENTDAPLAELESGMKVEIRKIHRKNYVDLLKSDDNMTGITVNSQRGKWVFVTFPGDLGSGMVQRSHVTPIGNAPATSAPAATPPSA